MAKMNETNQITNLRQDLRNIRGNDSDNYDGVLYNKQGAPSYLANKHTKSPNIVVS